MDIKEKGLNAQPRTLEIWKRLADGESLQIEQLALEYGKNKETIKRDIRHIRDALGDLVIYSKKENSYSLKTNERLAVGQAFVLLLLLYNSRSLEKSECREIADRILERFSDPIRQRLTKFFNSFHVHYRSSTTLAIIKTLEEVFTAITEQKQVRFRYPSRKTPGEFSDHQVIPTTITYLKGCYYLLARLEGKSGLAHYRIDRVRNLEILSARFRIALGADYLEVGEYHNRSFNMFSGERATVRLKLRKGTEEYLMRECPQVHIVSSDAEDDFLIVEAEVLGFEGILFWLLSQEDRVEVLSPPSLRSRMIETIERMRDVYRST